MVSDSRGCCGFGGTRHAHVANHAGRYVGSFQQLAHALAFGARAHDGNVFLVPLAQVQVFILEKMRQQLPAHQRRHGPHAAQNNQRLREAPGIEEVRGRRNQQRTHGHAPHNARSAHRLVVASAQVSGGEPDHNVSGHGRRHVLGRVVAGYKLVVALPVGFQEVYPSPNQAGVE